MPRPADRGGSAISVTTLVIASVASVAATFVVARVWGPGTLIGAAVTPVIVALVSEALRRPAERLPPIPGVALPDLQQGRARGRGSRPDEPGDFTAPRKDFRRRRWRVALVTGLAAFVLVVAAFTLADLVSGKPVTGRGRSSLFDPGEGGHRHTATQTTPTAPSTTVTVTRSTTTGTPLTVTSTVPAPATTQPTAPAPAPGVATAQTTPAPSSTGGSTTP